MYPKNKQINKLLKSMKVTNTWRFAPSVTGSSEPRSRSQLMNNLKSGLGLKDAFFSSASFIMNLTATARIYHRPIEVLGYKYIIKPL